MKKIFSILALALAAMTASADVAAFDLTVGKSEKGKIAFLVSGTTPATTDACSYEGNSMVPTIVGTKYPVGRYLMMKDNGFHTMSANGEVPACKAVFDTNKQ